MVEVQLAIIIVYSTNVAQLDVLLTGYVPKNAYAPQNAYFLFLLFLHPFYCKTKGPMVDKTLYSEGSCLDVDAIERDIEGSSSLITWKIKHLKHIWRLILSFS